MRILGMLLLSVSASVQAATLDISVAQGGSQIQEFSLDLSEERQSLDLRESHRYSVAVSDKTRGKDICREAEYLTGLMLTFKNLEATDQGLSLVEVVGQQSIVEDLATTEVLSCGANQSPVIQTRAFSTTTTVEEGRPRAIVIDGDTTLLLSLKPE